MVTRQKIDGITWVDIESPSNAELAEVADEFFIDPFIIQELKSPTIRQTVVSFDEYLYLILHFPVKRQSNSGNESQEVDFIIGENFLITVRYDLVDKMHKMHKLLETETILDREPEFKNAGELFAKVAMGLYKGVNDELEYQNSNIKNIEQKVFSGQEKEMVRDISEVSKTLLSFKLTLATHKDILNSLHEAGAKFFKQSFSRFVQTLKAESYRLAKLTESYLGVVGELRETNNSLLSTKQNEIMQVLTILAFVTFPLSLVAGIFGMNTKYIPIVGAPHDFWIVLGLMLTMTTAFFIYFKIKKWL